MNNLRCILFDLDGTLYDQRSIRRTMTRLLLRHALLHPFSGVRDVRLIQAYRKAQEELRKDCERPQPLAEIQLRIACERTGEKIARAERVIRQWIDEIPLPYLRAAIVADLVDFLEHARASDLKLGVVSDYPARQKLAAMELSGYFDAVVSAQDADQGHFKPHPNGLLRAMQQLDVTPDQTVFVGDRLEVDGEAARHAGLQFYLYSPVPATGVSGKCNFFSSYNELRGQLLGETTRPLPNLKSDRTYRWKEGIDRPLQPIDLRITDAGYGTTLPLKRCRTCGSFLQIALHCRIWWTCTRGWKIRNMWRARSRGRCKCASC